MAQILTKKYRTFRNIHGNYSDPLFDYDKSTTYHFDNNCAEFDDEKSALSEVIKTKYKFKESDLSEKTKEKFKEKGIKAEKENKKSAKSK